MNKRLLASALLSGLLTSGLVACAPRASAPTPDADEVIVETTLEPQVAAVTQLSEAQAAGVVGFTRLNTMINQQVLNISAHLPPGFEPFTLPSGRGSIQRLSPLNAPMQVRMYWRSVQPQKKQMVNVQWDLRPTGGKLLGVKLMVGSNSPQIDTRELRQQLLDDFLKDPSVRLVKKGR